MMLREKFNVFILPQTPQLSLGGLFYTPKSNT